MDKFGGFSLPHQNWSKLPHELIDALPLIRSQSELVVILYILRHTWGFQEFGVQKRLTLDEFQHGRKQRDGSRIDQGTGLSRPAILRGLRYAAEDGFIEVEVDESDKGRVKKSYSLVMSEVNDSLPQGYRNVTPGVTKRYPRGNETLPRSEKDTLERNQKKEQQQPPQLDDGFRLVYQAYISTFGSLMSPLQYERFKDLWEEYPEAEIHEVAREEMRKAMMRKENPVAPNLNYYAKCLQTETLRNWVIIEEDADENSET